MTESDYKDLELVEVKLPRKDLEILREMLEREAAYSWFTKKLKSYWIWGVAGGVLTVALLYHEIVGIFK